MNDIVCVCACVCVYACVFLCVCVCQREREWETEGEPKREIHMEGWLPLRVIPLNRKHTLLGQDILSGMCVCCCVLVCALQWSTSGTQRVLVFLSLKEISIAKHKRLGSTEHIHKLITSALGSFHFGFKLLWTLLQCVSFCCNYDLSCVLCYKPTFTLGTILFWTLNINWMDL